MNAENFTEEGIVVNSGNGNASIMLKNNEGCEECSAKIICKPSEVDDRKLDVIDPFGVKPGDEVIISLKGSAVFKASLMLYGMPLLLLLGGIFSVFFLYNGSQKELISFLAGLLLNAVYFPLYYCFSKKGSKKSYKPSIITVKKK